MNLTKHNSPEEVEALRTLVDGFVPEIDEATFVGYWLPRFMSGDDQYVVIDWVQKITKNPNQIVAIMRNGVRVATVPSALAPWPTEIPANVRGTVSEIFASSEAAARNIPMAGTTMMRKALDAQFGKMSSHPAVIKARDAHHAKWMALAEQYGFRPKVTIETTPLNSTPQPSEGLFDDYEML